MRAQLIARSTNIKTGPISTSNSSSDTCPDACPLKGGQCYAMAHPYIKSNWDKLDNGYRGFNWDQFIKEVSAIPDNSLWRHNVAGDLPGWNNKIDRKLLDQLVQAHISQDEAVKE